MAWQYKPMYRLKPYTEIGRKRNIIFQRDYYKLYPKYINYAPIDELTVFLLFIIMLM